MGEKGGITRRKMISALGVTGMAMLGGSTGFAAQERHERMTTQKLEDPKNKYPKTAFQRAIATVARPGEQDGAAPGSRGEKL